MWNRARQSRCGPDGVMNAERAMLLVTVAVALVCLLVSAEHFLGGDITKIASVFL